jgi:hypothetical protein
MEGKDLAKLAGGAEGDDIARFKRDTAKVRADEGGQVERKVCPGVLGDGGERELAVERGLLHFGESLGEDEATARAASICERYLEGEGLPRRELHL